MPDLTAEEAARALDQFAATYRAGVEVKTGRVILSGDSVDAMLAGAAALREIARLREALRSTCPMCGDAADTMRYNEGVNDDGDPWGVEHLDLWCESGCGRWTVPLASPPEGREEET